MTVTARNSTKITPFAPISTINALHGTLPVLVSPDPCLVSTLKKFYSDQSSINLESHYPVQKWKSDAVQKTSHALRNPGDFERISNKSEQPCHVSLRQMIDRRFLVQISPRISNSNQTHGPRQNCFPIPKRSRNPAIHELSVCDLSFQLKNNILMQTVVDTNERLLIFSLLLHQNETHRRPEPGTVF